MSNYATKHAETMVEESRYKSNDSQVRKRKPRIQPNKWIPCYMNGCKEGIFTKNNDEMIVPLWVPLYGGGEFETGIILDKPPYLEDKILNVMLPGATNNFKFADLVGKGAAIKVTFNGIYTNLVDIAPLDEQDEANLQAKKKAATAKKHQQQQDVDAFEGDMDAEIDEQPKVPQRKAFGSSRSKRARSNQKQAHSQGDEEFLDELEDDQEELALELDEDDDGLDLDLDLDDDDDESESY